MEPLYAHAQEYGALFPLMLARIASFTSQSFGQSPATWDIPAFHFMVHQTLNHTPP